MRQEFPARVKEQALERSGGHCEGVKADGSRCGLPLQKGRMTYDHRIPDWLGGEPTLDNCQVLGWCCDKPKTAGDQTTIAKTKRMRRRDSGIKNPSRFSCSRDSKWKKRIDGTVVPR